MGLELPHGGRDDDSVGLAAGAHGFALFDGSRGGGFGCSAGFSMLDPPGMYGTPWKVSPYLGFLGVKAWIQHIPWLSAFVEDELRIATDTMGVEMYMIRRYSSTGSTWWPEARPVDTWILMNVDIHLLKCCESISVNLE